MVTPRWDPHPDPPTPLSSTTRTWTRCGTSAPSKGSRLLGDTPLGPHPDPPHRGPIPPRYFGSVEGSYHVENLSAKNMKRTFVNYGETRDWFDKQQGEVSAEALSQAKEFLPSHHSLLTMELLIYSQGKEFLLEAVECKNIWVPMGA